MTVSHGYAMGVDLGTSNTVAVVRWPDGRTRPLLVDGVPVLPSGVCLDENGHLHVGRDAQRMARVEPARFEPNPKRRVDEGIVLLGDREVPTVQLFAAILGRVAQVALEVVGHLPPTVLTYPAAWGLRRRDALAAAATLAGWPPARLIPEPVGAARYFADVLRRPVPVGSSIAVFDFGGGTLDVAVVRNEGDRFAVLGSGGIQDLGGLDIDAALVEHLGRTIAAASADTWQALSHPTTTAQRRDRRLFWDDVRGAKEMLSRVAMAPVPIPGVDTAVHLTREELESVAAPLLQGAVRETGAVIRGCGLRPDQLAGLFLVGGSSRLPLAARMLHNDLGIAPTVLEQPELPVAEGAIAELTPVLPTATGPVVAPVATPTTVTTPAPVSGAPPVTPPLPTTATARAAKDGPDPDGRRARPEGRTWVVAAAALLVIALAATGGWWYFTGETLALSAAMKSDPVTVPYDGSPTRVVTSTLGDIVYMAWTRGNVVDVAAVDLVKNKKLWQKRAPAGAEQWETMQATPNGITLFPDGISADEPKPLFVLDPRDGTLKWQRPINVNETLFYYEAAMVHRSAQDKVVRGLDWSTGAELWKLPYRTDDQNNALATRLIRVNNSDEVRLPSLPGDRVRVTAGGNARILMIDAKEGMQVVDVATGRQHTATGIQGAYNNPVHAVDDKLYVVAVSNGYQVREFDLNNPGPARVVYTEADSSRKVTISPIRCGVSRLCFIEQNGSDAGANQVVAVDTVSAKLVWRKPAPGVNVLLAMSSGVLATNSGASPSSFVFESAGRQLIPDDLRSTFGARADESNVLLFSRQLSASGGATAVTRMTLDGKRTVFGPFDAKGSSCSWNDKFLTCGGEQELRVLRFTP